MYIPAKYLNPYSNGIRSVRYRVQPNESVRKVLILILMEYAL